MNQDLNCRENPSSCRRLVFEQVETHLNRQQEDIEKDHVSDFENSEYVIDDHPSVSKVNIPAIGMEFDSEKAAYQFYNEYANACGFSIRRSTVHKDIKGNILDRKFVCSCEGQKGQDKRDVFYKSCRPQTRTDCCAQMKINSRYTSKYVVVEFVAEHKGHELVSPNKIHMLRSHRNITSQQAIYIDNIDRSGIAPKAGLTYLSQQVGGREKVGFTLEDMRNYLHSKRTMQMKEGDAGGLLNYLQVKHSEDPNFYSAIQVDEDDLITNIFWADGQMMAGYVFFGDAICFDTTYRKNKEGRPFALLVGVNHHKQTTVFGAALLYDETAETFMWLFKTFEKAMNGKRPETILTDQDAAMAKALKEIWPETCHRLCIWHIYQNAATHLSNIFTNFPNFSNDFSSCIYGYEEEEEFINAWHAMLEKYGLQNNEWLERMFKIKEKWALVYGRQSFCADMTTTQRSESMNSVLKKYVSNKHNLLQFLHHFDRLVIDRRYSELEVDMRTKRGTLELPFEVKILQHARDVYTHKVFKLFQKELSYAHDSKLEVIAESEVFCQYKITPLDKRYFHTVTYDASNGMVFCSCKKFEFAGILCSHALKVLNARNIVRIPEPYIKKRWSKKAKKWVVEPLSQPLATSSSVSEKTNEENEKMKIGERYRELCRLFSQLATRAAKSDDTYDFVKGIACKAIEEVDVMMASKIMGKPSHTPNNCVKNVCASTVVEKQISPSQVLENEGIESLQNEDSSLNIAGKSSDENVIRGLKIRQTSKVKSRKRLKSGLEQATKRRKPKNNKISSSMLCSAGTKYIAPSYMPSPQVEIHHRRYMENDQPSNTSMTELLQAQMFQFGRFVSNDSMFETQQQKGNKDDGASGV